MNLKKRKLSYLIIIILVLLLFAFAYSFIYFGHPNIQEHPDNYITKIIDGDTFELASGESVRLICIDAPEKNEQGFELSANYLSELILYKLVRLEKDVSETDEYGRLLRYVYVNVSESNDEIFVNKELVSKGYAFVWEYGNDTARCDEIKIS